MRKGLIWCVLLLVVACGRDDARFTLEGRLGSAEEGEMVCLCYPTKRGDTWYEEVDTTHVESGTFSFEGVVADVVPAYLHFENMDFAKIYIEPSRITFSAERDALYDYTLQGLSIDDEIAEYKETFGGYDGVIYELLHQVQLKNRAWAAAFESGAENVDELWTEFYALVLEHHAIAARWPVLAEEFVRTHPDYTIVPNIVAGLVEYGEVESLYENLSEGQRGGAMGELLVIKRNIGRTCGGEVGGSALDFALEEARGGVVRLSECYARGFVLLDFWASWCRPCIGEIPRVKELNKRLGDELQILSVSVDQDDAQWREAIEQYDLDAWPQLRVSRPDAADSYYFREQADLSLAYGVEEIPCFMLVDTDGVIVGRWAHLTNEVITEIEARVRGAL